MTETKSSWKTKLLIYGGFLIVGFIGILAGNWFINWRNAEAKAKHTRSYGTQNYIKLKQNDIFPKISLINSEGFPVNSHDILRGRNTAIMFVSPTCSPCTEAIQTWSTFYDKLPSDFQVIAITNAYLESASEYLTGYDFPYPFFCDTGYVLIKEYGINRYPSIMCINGNMQIVEPYHSPYNDFSPLDAYELIRTSPNK